jgi:hypothetical protein
MQIAKQHHQMLELFIYYKMSVFHRCFYFAAMKQLLHFTVDLGPCYSMPIP